MEYLAFAIALAYGIALWLVCGSAKNNVNARSKYYQAYAGSQYLFTRSTTQEVWGYMPTAINDKYSLDEIKVYECCDGKYKLIHDGSQPPEDPAEEFEHLLRGTLAQQSCTH